MNADADKHSKEDESQGIKVTPKTGSKVQTTMKAANTFAARNKTQTAGGVIKPTSFGNGVKDSRGSANTNLTQPNSGSNNVKSGDAMDSNGSTNTKVAHRDSVNNRVLTKKSGADATPSTSSANATVANLDDGKTNKKTKTPPKGKLIAQIALSNYAHLSEFGNACPTPNILTLDSNVLDNKDVHSNDAAGLSSADNEMHDTEDQKVAVVKKKRGGRKVREHRERMARNAAEGKVQQSNTVTNQHQNSSNAVMKQKGGQDVPAAQTDQPQQANRSSAPNKRSLAKGETPPDLGHVSKKGRTRQPPHKRIQRTQLSAAVSTAQAVIDANLLVAVVDMPVPGVTVPLTKEKYDALYKAIDAKVFECVCSDSSIIPRFGENVFIRGVMKLHCSTPATKSWLHSTIQDIPLLWKNMKLNVINFADLPTPNKVLGTFKNCTVGDERILFALGRLNQQINTACWTIYSINPSELGVHVTFGITDDQLVILRGLKFALHFGAGVAIFKDISSKKKKSDNTQDT
ncbi:MAG: DUF4780 domain-containing protein, partial [Sphingobacteriaceae bacterium]